MTTFGGKHKVSQDAYHAIPPGWELEAVLEAHARLGGTFDLRAEPIPDSWPAWSKYRGVLYAIAQGVRANDPASVELAVRFIQLHLIGSYAGFLRSLLARRLKHVALSEQQRERLSAHFFGLVQSGERCQEFRQFLGLWRVIISVGERAGLEQWVGSRNGAESEFGKKLLEKLAQPARPVRRGGHR